MLSLSAAVLLAASLTGDTALIDFSADWCGPCRQMDPTVARLSALGYPIRKVNIDHEKALAAQFQVRSIPCFVLVVDGKEVDRVVGATSFERLHEMLSRHAVGKGSNVNQARGQSPDRAPRPSTYDLASIDRPTTGPAAAMPRSAAPASAAPRNADPDLGARLLAASVRLKINDPNGHSFGSGTIIEYADGEALILTCGHIFRDSQGRGHISVDLFGAGAPQGVPGQLVGYDLKSDVGLVSFRPGCQVQAAEVAELRHPVRRGDQVINIGCNNGGEPTLRTSHVASLDKFLGPPNVQVAGQPVQGRSGGGLFTADGRVIGVCNAADPADDEGLYAALPSIWAQLDRHVPRFAQRSHSSGQSNRVDSQLATIPGRKIPAMAERMPASNVASQPIPQPLPAADERTFRANEAPRTLSREVQSTLAELQRRDPQAEVICIVRSPNSRSGESEIVVLDRASQDFLSTLAAERSVQGAYPANGSAQRQVADSRWPASGGSAAVASTGSQPRPFAVNPDLLQPATHSRTQPNGWKPQWMKPN